MRNRSSFRRCRGSSDRRMRDVDGGGQLGWGGVDVEVRSAEPNVVLWGSQIEEVGPIKTMSLAVFRDASQQEPAPVDGTSDVRNLVMKRE